MDFIIEQLKENQDEKYSQFQRKLLPTLKPESIIGVRTPILRKMAKQLKKDIRCEVFLTELPHTYFEENQLHGFIVSEITDFQICVYELERFLPYMDNWATCDQTSPKVFGKYKKELLPYIDKWLKSQHTYTVRFAIGMLMQHFLDDDFRKEYLEMVSGVRSEEYYINMEIAWYMATALAKQWDATIPYIENNRLDRWTHNRTIQKARESYRITNEQKEYLVKFRRH
jgi:3-methyladenine DNA glycosylase AlkD